MWIKKNVLRIVGNFGFEIRRVPAKSPAIFQDTNLSHFESCIHLLLAFRAKINILQVGANDGCINDPIYRFVSNFSNRTKIILVEPQEYLLPYLQENYRFHKEKYIYNGAVGPNKIIKLHRVRKEFWDELDVSYAKQWPLYRAPTGVTSTEYSHVALWLSKCYHGKRHINDLIETIVVECLDVRSLMKNANLFNRLDVLQVDAESFDDEVIYASNIAELRPSIINFEIGNLTAIKANALIAFLIANGYQITHRGNDGLAIRTNLVDEI